MVRGAGAVSLLEGLQPERLIGYGESQSAMRMVSYVNGVHPLVEQYDGFFIHSRGAGGTPFGGGGTPVLGSGVLGYLPARQADTDRLRTWEVAGTAHADQHILDFNAAARMGGVGLMCEGVNDGPKHFVIKAALHALDAWMRDGTEPPRGDLLETAADGAPVKDEHGNTLGGIRTPDVDVPIATLSGDAPPGGQVTYSREAAAQLAEAKQKAAANPEGANAAYYASIAKAIRDVIQSPALVLLPQNMLKGDLAGVLRVKVGRRQRIFYLAASQKERAIVLLLGYRKAGDKNDAYSVFERLLRRGAFDVHFTELGVTKPKLQAAVH